MTAAAYHVTDAPPRAVGAARLGVGRRAPKTVLRDFYQSGSLKCLFPRSPEASLTAVTLNTAGGLTGGDVMTLDVDVAEQADLIMTTQAAERAYCAQPGEIARVATTIRVAEGARVAWLPQETLLYDKAALSRRLTVDLTGSAEALIVEPLVFGRTAMQERLTHLDLTDRIDVRRNGSYLVSDRTRLNGPAHAQLDAPAVADGAHALASVIWVSPKSLTLLKEIRDMLPASGGASLLEEDCMILRCLAPDSHALRQVLVPILHRLTDRPLPRTWML